MRRRRPSSARCTYSWANILLPSGLMQYCWEINIYLYKINVVWTIYGRWEYTKFDRFTALPRRRVAFSVGIDAHFHIRVCIYIISRRTVGRFRWSIYTKNRNRLQTHAYTLWLDFFNQLQKYRKLRKDTVCGYLAFHRYNQADGFYILIQIWIQCALRNV